MRILRPTLPEPPDQVIQNLTIGDSPLGPAFEPWQDLGVNWQGERVLQGEWTTSRIPEFPVPRAMVGWNPYFAQASSIGPMAIQGGAVGMVPIGPAKQINPMVDPVLLALYSQVPLDSTGAIAFDGIMMPSQSEPVLDSVLSDNPVLTVPPEPTNPRREIRDSGLLKIMTAAKPPDTFGAVLYPGPQSSTVFTMTGTTVTGAGVPEGNCRVIAYQSGWRYVGGGTKIIAETVSDGSGAFSLLLRNIDYQLVGYKVGSPDLAGLTRQDVTPVASTTIYMRDPTVATPAGSGGGMRLVGHGGLAA